jgi:hypothetical protein
MDARERAWWEHRRKQFLRPDFERWLKPDWRDGKYWVTPPPEWATHPDEAHLPPPAGYVERKRAEKEIAQLRGEIAQLVAEFRQALAPHLRKYHPDQPRVPAGNPDGGQWTSGGGADGADSNGGEDETPDVSAARRSKGHHVVPRQLFESRPFSKDAKKVFEEGSTGPLRDPSSNYFDREHRLYNQAVEEHLNRYLERNGIRPETMTSDQAREFLQELRRSGDTRVRNFNMRMLLRELMRSPLRSRGNE